MRKYAEYSVAVAGALFVLVVFLWANTHALTSNAALNSRSEAGTSPYQIELVCPGYC
jgi:hypothetical protein